MRKSYVKQLRSLLEGEVEQAEVIIATKGIAKELQDMIEKVGRLTNEDLGPVCDQMRQTYGKEVSDPFRVAIQAEMENILDTLRNAKEVFDDSANKIARGESFDFNGESDLDNSEFNEYGDEDFSDGESEFSDDDFDTDDGFGTDELEEPLGRAALESRRIELERQIVEMRQKLSRARKLAESKKSK